MFKIRFNFCFEELWILLNPETAFSISIIATLVLRWTWCCQVYIKNYGKSTKNVYKISSVLLMLKLSFFCVGVEDKFYYETKGYCNLNNYKKLLAN